MAILWGDKREDGLIRVWRTLHTADATIEKCPDGYEFDAIPAYPAAKKGINFIWLFNPLTKENTFEEEARELTDKEVLTDINAKLDELLALNKVV